jgi:hypothetical protein
MVSRSALEPSEFGLSELEVSELEVSELEASGRDVSAVSDDLFSVSETSRAG